MFLKKYIFSPRKEWLKTDSFITLIGLIISVAILTATLSIFSGYQKLLKKTILGVNSHIYVFSMQNNMLSKEESQKAEEFLKKQPEVKEYHELITQGVLVEKSNKIKAAVIRGINAPENIISKYVIKGSRRLKANNLIMGYRLANRLSANVGDTIRLTSPKNDMISIFGIKNKKEFYKITGLYRSGMYEYDNNFIWMNKDESDFFDDKSHITLIEIKLKDKFISDAAYIAYKWNKLLGNKYQINSWIDYNGNLFSLLTLEKWVIFIILSFLILIASFNIISSVSTAIIKEKKNIGILKTFGMKDSLLKKIFLLKTMFLSVLGIIIGEITGVILTFVITHQNFYKLRAKVYFIDKITADYSVYNFLIIAAVTIVIIWVSSVIPLKKISKLKIISILRA